MIKDQSAERAIVEAGHLIARFGAEAAAEALLKAIDCAIAGDRQAADFWIVVHEEALDAMSNSEARRDSIVPSAGSDPRYDPKGRYNAVERAPRQDLMHRRQRNDIPVCLEAKTDVTLKELSEWLHRDHGHASPSVGFGAFLPSRRDP